MGAPPLRLSKKRGLPHAVKAHKHASVLTAIVGVSTCVTRWKQPDRLRLVRLFISGY
jgi:hypothetical protein